MNHISYVENGLSEDLYSIGKLEQDQADPLGSCEAALGSVMFNEDTEAFRAAYQTAHES